MQPSYYVNSTYYCDDEKSKPKRLPQYISDNHLLMTSDIEGAQAGYRSEHQLSLPNSMRKEFRNTNYVNDIEGAQANTKKSTFVTTRCSNPLQPVYKSLDGDSLLGGPVEGLVPAHFIEKNTFNFKTFGSIPERAMKYPSKDSVLPSSARETPNSSQNIQPRESELNFTSTSTTSQYFDIESSTFERRNSDDIGAKSYAEKIHIDNHVFISDSSIQPQNQINHQDSGPKNSSQSNAPNPQTRRSLSAVPRLSRDSGVLLSATNPSRILSARGKSDLRSNSSSQVSTSRSQKSQPSGRKLSHNDSLSSRRQLAELEAEISAIRGL